MSAVVDVAAFVAAVLFLAFVAFLAVAFLRGALVPIRVLRREGREGYARWWAERQTRTRP